MIVAHRGASKDAPENTLEAFRLAWQQGADAIEGDFRLTRDGHIVCIHDEDTQRVAGRKRMVRHSTLAALRELDVGAWHGESFKGCRIPTLEEVMATIPRGRQLFLEVKCGPEIIPALKKALDASELATRQVVIISFNLDVIREAKKTLPSYEANLLCSFQTKRGSISPALETVLQNLDKSGADGLSTNGGIPPSTARKVKDAGYGWHVWTVDNPERARQFRDLGVDSITTNLPGAIRRELRE